MGLTNLQLSNLFLGGAGGGAVVDVVWEEIDRVTLAVASADMRIASIPATFDTLVGTVWARSDNTTVDDAQYLFVNDDFTSSRYQFARHIADNVTHAVSSGSNFDVGTCPGGNAVANSFGLTKIEVPQYASNKRKVVSSISNYSATNTRLVYTTLTLSWITTDAIDTLTISTSVGGKVFLADSEFILYGLKPIP